MDKLNTAETKYLSFTNFIRLKFWDYYTLSQKSNIESKYDLVELSDVLTQRKESIIIDDSEIYKRCRVQIQGKGVVLRDEVYGRDIKTKKQQLCKEDDFLVAEIDAKVGGYGIVPRELNNAVVSGHYFLFEVNKNKLLPDFLGILVKCYEFSKQVKATGSTNYAAIRPYHVLSYLIPLPSIVEQKKNVSAYNKKIKLAVELEEKAVDIENSIEDYLYNELGLRKFDQRKNNSKLRTINFREVERWAVDTLGKLLKIEEKFKGIYPLIKLREFIVSYQYGLSEKSSTEKIGQPMLRMNNIHNSDLDVTNLKYIEIDDPTFSKYKLTKGDLLFNRTNSKELVGKTALFNFNEDFTFASYLIRVVIDNKKVDVKYINYLFNSSVLQYQKDLVSRQITGQANINAQEMQEFLFPLPPLSKQKEIVSTIERMKNEIKKLKRQAEQNRIDAINDFEKEVFIT